MVVDESEQAVSPLQLPARDDPLLNVELGRDCLCVLYLLSKVVSVHVLLSRFVGVHGQ
jgi:hypothetical protein